MRCFDDGRPLSLQYLQIADFDLCHTCVAQGIRCFEPEHRLTKRILKNGSIVNEA